MIQEIAITIFCIYLLNNTFVETFLVVYFFLSMVNTFCLVLGIFRFLRQKKNIWEIWKFYRERQKQMYIMHVEPFLLDEKFKFVTLDC